MSPTVTTVRSPHELVTALRDREVEGNTSIRYWKLAGTTIIAYDRSAPVEELGADLNHRHIMSAMEIATRMWEQLVRDEAAAELEVLSPLNAIGTPDGLAMSEAIVGIIRRRYTIHD